ncbi:hypothetical protein [Nostoc sp. UIC 10630]|uniref:hypothetical protein n=1 Tax=Nostoc sp. UIC 10630 TaxID=2100146 RepID=UPI0013D755A1|nr:hypothetical protein [Nostoc sp. UIC 10630]NEU79883.1 hypothetical protein [Nostoc sp. UIC 10630]
MVNTKPYWEKLKQTLLSPEFHWLFLKARLKVNFLTSPLYRRLMAVGFTVVVVVLVSVNHSWLTFIVAWAFPLTVLYHMGALLQFLSEHDWAGSGTNESKSHGRFCGDTPPFGQSTLAWLRWGMRMVYHLFVRIAILPGEMPEHDWHHHSPKDQKDWANGTYARQRQVEGGGEYTEFWGLENAIDHVFQGFAQASAPLEEPESNSLDELPRN